MKNILFLLSFIIIVLASCKKDEVEPIYISPLIGLWEIVQTETTHELGHYGPYDPPVREIDSRETHIIDHQNNFSTINILSDSLTWTEVNDSMPKEYSWDYQNMMFSLTNNDTTLDYYVTELSSQNFTFFIKDFRIYNDSTNLVAYEEYQYVYHLNKVND